MISVRKSVLTNSNLKRNILSVMSLPFAEKKVKAEKGQLFRMMYLLRIIRIPPLVTDK